MGKNILLYNNIFGIFLESNWQHFNWKINLYQKLLEIITMEEWPRIGIGEASLSFVQEKINLF